MSRRPAPAPAPPPKAGPPVALIGSVLVLALIVVGVILYLILRPAPNPWEDVDVSGEGSSPSAQADGGGLYVGDPSEGAPSVQVYEDFQCPWCGLLESTSGDALVEAAEAGEIELTYHLMSFMDRQLDNDASARATNAALCADDHGAFVPYHQAVFAGQPEETGAGWSDEELEGFAEEAGLAGDELESFRACAEEGTHADYVTKMQARASQDGVSGSPYIFIDGTEISEEEMEALMEDPDALGAVLSAYE